MSSLFRVITKLDIKGPNLIKGICYEGNRVLGHANYFSELYAKEGADEIFFMTRLQVCMTEVTYYLFCKIQQKMFKYQ